MGCVNRSLFFACFFVFFCLHVSNFLQACNCRFPTSFYGVGKVPWPHCSFFWPLIMSMLKREHRIGYMLKNVPELHTAIFEIV